MNPEKIIHIILLLGMGISWTIVYLLVIYRSFKDKSYGIPFVALVLNMSWEFIYSFVEEANGANLQLYINRVWFFLDVVIFGAYILYGIKDWPVGRYRQWFYPHLIFCTVAAALLLYYMHIDLDDYSITFSAFLINLLMSALFINMILKRNSLQAQSFGIALFKLTGTISATIILFGNFSAFLRLTGIITFILDMIYLLIVLNMYKQQRLHLITRKIIHRAL